MILISFIFGGTIGAFTMALFSVSAYERGYGDGYKDREIE